MGKIYCCAKDCSNYSGKIVDDRTISLHRFPADGKISRIWSQRVGCFRKDFRQKSTSRLCSDHFVGLAGPSKTAPVPNIFPQKTFKTWTVDDISLFMPPTTSSDTDADVDRNDCNSYEENESLKLSLLESSTLNVSVHMHDYTGPASRISSKVNKCEQTCTVQVKDSSTQTDFKVTCNKKPETVDVGIQCNKPDIAVEDIKDNDSEVQFYTGIPTFVTLMLLFNTIKVKAQNMSYWKGEKSGGEKEYQLNGKKKPGPTRKLRLIEEFLLVLMRLRLGLCEEDLAHRFHISTALCSSIWRTWVRFLSNELVPLLLLWPRREVVSENMPESFKRRYPNTRVILDCTEIWTETPESLQAKSLMYSNYKSHMTWKILVGVSPCGVISFVSDCYAGSISDKKITELSGVVDLCEPGDSIMVDKGFLISDLTTPKEIALVIPHFKSKNKQFTRRQVEETRRIANLRIHVEREIQRIKVFKILNGVMPISCHLTVSDVFKICAALTTLQPSLVQD